MLSAMRDELGRQVDRQLGGISAQRARRGSQTRRRPSFPLQEHAEERPKTLTHVGHEEIKALSASTAVMIWIRPV
jgi:hypothetical protein